MKLFINESEDNTLKTAMEKFTRESQYGMVNEECGELLAALNQFKRGRIPAIHVAEEIADVILMMAQLSKIIGEQEVQNWLDMKVARFVQRVKEGKDF